MIDVFSSARIARNAGDADLYAQKLQEIIDSGDSEIRKSFEHGLFKKGISHFFEQHVAKTHAEFASRIIKQHKDCVSCFRSEADALDFLCETLYSKANSIGQWLSGSSREEQGPDVDAYGDWATTVNFDVDEAVGFGFNDKFEELETSDICVVLRKEKSSDLGFYVHTAYPDLHNKDHVHPTGFQLSGAALHDADNRLSSMYRSYVEIKRELTSEENVTFIEDATKNFNKSMIHFRAEDKDNLNFDVWLGEDSHPTFIKVNNVKVAMDAAAIAYPEFYQRVCHFQDIIDTEKKLQLQKNTRPLSYWEEKVAEARKNLGTPQPQASQPKNIGRTQQSFSKNGEER